MIVTLHKLLIWLSLELHFIHWICNVRNSIIISAHMNFSNHIKYERRKMRDSCWNTKSSQKEEEEKLDKD